MGLGQMQMRVVVKVKDVAALAKRFDLTPGEVMPEAMDHVPERRHSSERAVVWQLEPPSRRHGESKLEIPKSNSAGQRIDRFRQKIAEVSSGTWRQKRAALAGESLVTGAESRAATISNRRR
jgi:hypothetical protein